MSTTKRLRVFAGPNGSEKSTLFSTIAQKFPVGYFVNSVMNGQIEILVNENQVPNWFIENVINKSIS